MHLNYHISDIAKCVKASIVGQDITSLPIVKQVIIDSRSPLINQNCLFFALKGTRSHGHDYVKAFENNGGKMVVVEKHQPSVKLVQLIVEDTLTALQQLAIYHRSQHNISVIAVTGSSGKTTVKEWLYHVLKNKFSVIRSPKSYNSQIGVPLSVLEMTSHHNLAVFEAGISKPGEMAILKKIIKPDIGVYTGIGQSHQHNFESLEEKELEKLILFKDTKVYFSPNDVDTDLINEIPFKSLTANLNVGLVKKVAEYLGLENNEINTALSALPYLSMRMEKMEGSNGNTLINDTYTFDEKGLEIALNSLRLSNENYKRILVLAPDSSYTPNESLASIIEANQIHQLIWIHPKPISLNKDVLISQFSSVEAFIQNPIPFQDSIILFSGSRSMRLERCIPIYQLKKHVTQLEINLEAIRKNLNYYRSKVKTGTKLLIMVKAQSYGGGSVEMAKFLSHEKVDALGVAYADEGVLLREAGITLPILVMNPEQAAFDDIIDYGLEPSLYNLEILDLFLNQLILRNKQGVPVHIKVDSGMHRLGFMKTDIEELIEMLNAQPEVYVKAVFSHLAAADNVLEREFTKSQIIMFNEICTQLEEGIGYQFTKHLSNTQGISNYPEANFDMVRIGIGLFGLGNPKSEELYQALRFKTQLSQIKTISEGDTVGYGRKFKANRIMNIGVIPVGYADGLSRGLSNGKWLVKINDRFAPIIGLICMDMCMLDLTGIDCQQGDNVEVFGWHNSIHEMSTKLDTIPYEIISSISSRVHRVYIN